MLFNSNNRKENISHLDNMVSKKDMINVCILVAISFLMILPSIEPLNANAIIYPFEIENLQQMKIKTADGKDMVILSGVAIVYYNALGGDFRNQWVRDQLYIQNIGPKWDITNGPPAIIPYISINTFTTGKPDRYVGMGVDSILPADIQGPANQIRLKANIAAVGDHTQLTRVGFYVVAVGKCIC